MHLKEMKLDQEKSWKKVTDWFYLHCLKVNIPFMNKAGFILYFCYLCHKYQISNTNTKPPIQQAQAHQDLLSA